MSQSEPKEDEAMDKVVKANMQALELMVENDDVPIKRVNGNIVAHEETLAKEFAELHLSAIENGT